MMNPDFSTDLRLKGDTLSGIQLSQNAGAKTAGQQSHPDEGKEESVALATRANDLFERAQSVSMFKLCGFAKYRCPGRNKPSKLSCKEGETRPAI